MSYFRRFIIVICDIASGTVLYVLKVTSSTKKKSVHFARVDLKLD